MNRRKAMTIAAGVIAGGGAGLLTLTNAFKPEIMFDNEPHKLQHNQGEDDWKYSSLTQPLLPSWLINIILREVVCMQQ